MSDQGYTPSRERLVLAYQKWAFLTSKDEAEAQVDRMLAEVARVAAEKAWWVGFEAGWRECEDPGAFVNDLHDAKTPNPYRIGVEHE